MVELHVVVEDHLGSLLHTIEAVVTQQEDVQLEICSLLLSFNVGQSSLKYSQI